MVERARAQIGIIVREQRSSCYDIAVQLGDAIGPQPRNPDGIFGSIDRPLELAGPVVAIGEVSHQSALALQAHARLSSERQRFPKQLGSPVRLVSNCFGLPAIAQRLDPEVW